MTEENPYWSSPYAFYDAMFWCVVLLVSFVSDATYSYLSILQYK